MPDCLVSLFIYTYVYLLMALFSIAEDFSYEQLLTCQQLTKVWAYTLNPLM